MVGILWTQADELYSKSTPHLFHHLNSPTHQFFLTSNTMADTVRRSARNKRPASPAGAKTRSKSNAPTPAHAALLKMKAKKTQPKSVKKTAQAEFCFLSLFVIPDVEPEVAEEENADEDEEPLNENITEEKHEDPLDAELPTEVRVSRLQAPGGSGTKTISNSGLSVIRTWLSPLPTPPLPPLLLPTAVPPTGASHSSLTKDSYKSDDSGSNYSTSAGVKEEMRRKQEVQDEVGGESEELQDEKDRFTDHAHIWGGSPVFHEANELYPGAIQQDLFDWKARIRNAVMERRRQAEGGGAEDSSTVALHIDFA
ncbi:hypothetical protein B0H14DRAFT_3783852 [Mycena olivaceomarginata]|nr:hypothetical protein B0H14DRAFT_3783852 [Mycena olivaceomarginata]